MTRYDEHGNPCPPCPEPHHHEHITHEILDLKLGSLKSDLRVMIIASVALNQVLSAVALPTALTVTAFVAALATPMIKAAILFLARVHL